MSIGAADSWPTNGHLIADVAQLGYIGNRVVDLSYGLGKFWTEWQPTELVKNDIDPAKGDHHHDVRSIPLKWCEKFDTAVWDGPYRLAGTRDLSEFDDRYGLASDRYQSSDEIMDLLKAGVAAAHDCARLGGTILVKCQDQVNGGRKVWQTRELTTVAERLGARLVDMFHLIGTGRPQPSGRAQRHTRSNYSTLLVLEKTSRIGLF